MRGPDLQIGLLNTATLQLRAIDTPYTMITNPLIASGKALCKAGAPCLPSAIVSLDLTTGESGNRAPERCNRD